MVDLHRLLRNITFSTVCTFRLNSKLHFVEQVINLSNKV